MERHYKIQISLPKNPRAAVRYFFGTALEVLRGINAVHYEVNEIASRNRLRKRKELEERITLGIRALDSLMDSPRDQGSDM